MGYCHKCYHAQEIAAGKFAAAAFEETPCARCELLDGSSHAIAFDEGRESVGSEPPTVGRGEIPCPASTEGQDLLPVSVMSEAIAALLLLRPHIRDVVSWRYAGMKYRDIAVLQGVTMAAVELRHRRALEKWPALKALFAVKAAKQKRRQPHGGSGCGSRAITSKNCGAKRR